MEFDLIRTYFAEPFKSLAIGSSRVAMGIGDDCALLDLPQNSRLCVSTDALLEGVHFFSDCDPFQLGHKALAVNLSDLAAAGAQPIGFTLSLALPSFNSSWLGAFSQGLLGVATRHSCPLVGGDTSATRPDAGLCISITVFGALEAAAGGLPRHAAQVGDSIWVSGTPGLARLGLLLEAQQRRLIGQFVPQTDLDQYCRLLAQLPAGLSEKAALALHQPEPRLALGQALHRRAHAAMDLSDGLTGDLSHIAAQSGVQLTLEVESLLGTWFELFPERQAEWQAFALELALVGGDDYELCFTAPPSQDAHFRSLSSGQPPLTRIGSVTAGQGVYLSQGGVSKPLVGSSFQHFNHNTWEQ